MIIGEVPTSLIWREVASHWLTRHDKDPYSQKQTHTHTHTLAPYTHIPTGRDTHTHPHTHTHTQRHTQTHIHSHTLTHSQTHTRTHTAKSRLSDHRSREIVCSSANSSRFLLYNYPSSQYAPPKHPINLTPNPGPLPCFESRGHPRSRYLKTLNLGGNIVA